MVEKLSVLIVDDEAQVRSAITRMMKRYHHETTAVGSGEEALEVYRKTHFDVVLLDLGLPGKSGLEVLDELREIERSLTIVVTADDSLSTALECMRRGAQDFVPKRELIEWLPRAMDRAEEKLRHERRFAASRWAESSQMGEMYGRSPAMLHVFELIERGARSPDTTVLITGESGTGKELAAKAIHQKSDRREGNFVAVNCTAFQESLLESEFFGHKKGAFTGADSDKRGLLEWAGGGTIFLDEIGDMPLPLQAKLLRFLEDRTFRRVGDTRERRSDARIVSATNKAIKTMFKEGSFREDLYYRLSVYPIELPPLRARREDIEMLTERFLDELCEKFRKSPKRVSPEAMEALRAYAWPGNVRELRNVIERLLFMVDEREILPEHLPKEINPHGRAVTLERGFTDLPYASAKKRFNESYICQLLSRHDGVVSHSARHAGMDRANWRRLMRRYGINTENYRDFLTGKTDPSRA